MTNIWIELAANSSVCLLTRRANGATEDVGTENAGPENTGTSCVWVARRNIINVVRG